MTCLADHKDFASYSAPQRRAADRGGILQRIFSAILKSRQRNADLEIARFIGRSGGRITDEVERQVMERVSQAAFGAPSR
jgi:hypothetical protein